VEQFQAAPGLIEALIAQARRAAPQEACGLLLGHDGRIDTIKAARNIADAPQTHFEIDPQTLIDAHRSARSNGPQIAGYYHSHPAGPPEPSATDRLMAAGDGKIWAIIGLGISGDNCAGANADIGVDVGGGADLGTVLFWRDTADGFERLFYVVSDS